MSGRFVWPPFKVGDVVYRLQAVDDDLFVDEVRIDAVRLAPGRKARFYLSSGEWTDDETGLYPSLTELWYAMQETPDLEPPVSSLWIVMKPLVDAVIRSDSGLRARLGKTRDGTPVMVVRLSEAWKRLRLEFGMEVQHLLGVSSRQQFHRALQREGLLVSRTGSEPPNYRYDITVDGVRIGHMRGIDITAWVGTVESLEARIGHPLPML